MPRSLVRENRTQGSVRGRSGNWPSYLNGRQVEKMKIRKSTVAIIIAFLIIWVFTLIVRDKETDISSPINYQKQNISFTYPGNWEVTEDAVRGRVRHLYVEGPVGAIFIVQIFSKQNAMPLNEYVKRLSTQSHVDKTFSSVEKPTKYGAQKGIKERFSLIIKGEKEHFVREYFSFEINDKVILLYSHSATEDIEKLEAGFNLILSSFIVE